MPAQPTAQASTAKRRVVRFSLRTLLLAVFVLCVAFALWQQHRRLQSANTVLEAHGLTWNLEPIKRDTFRVFVNEVVNDRDTQVRQITIETFGEPEIALVFYDGRRYPTKPATPPSNSGIATRTRVSIAVTELIGHQGDQNQEVKVFIRFDPPGSDRITRHCTNFPKHLNFRDAVELKLKPGEYPRGTPVDLLEIDRGEGNSNMTRLIVE